MTCNTAVKIVISCICLMSLNVFSQKDSSLTLNEVVISATQIKTGETGRKVFIADSASMHLYSSLPVSELLSGVSFINVRNYGPGSLANISIRGASSSHTGFFWNGIPVNPPNIAMSDASLMPVFLFDEIAVHPGGGSTHNGSGNIGGSIHLNDKPAFNKGLILSGEISRGSFSTNALRTKIEYSDSKIFSSTAYYRDYSLNDFPYENTAAFGSPLENQQNAAYKGEGVKQTIALRLPSNQMILFSTWYLNNSRQIPGSMTTRIQRAQQEDESLRSVIQYRKYRTRADYSLRVAAVNERLRYIDPDISLDSRFRTVTMNADAEMNFIVSPVIRMETGIRSNIQKAEVGAYQNSVNENQTALFSQLNFLSKNRRLKSALAVRKEFHSGYNTPILPYLGMDIGICDKLTANFAASRNFRAPSLNDRFWVPGGNEKLKPEKSTNFETGLKLENFTNILSKSLIDISLYDTYIDDLIEWLPQTGGIWMAANVKKVRAKGVSLGLAAETGNKNLKCFLSANYSYTNTINLNERFPGDLSAGKRIMYLPANKFVMNSGLRYKRFSGGFIIIHNGQRFINTDNTAFLPPYTIMDLFIDYQVLNFKGMRGNLLFQIKNLGANEYQVFEYRPMPGRSYIITVKFCFNKNKS